MRIRNGNRILSHEAVIEPQELEEIEVLSFSVIDEEKLKEISPQMHNDLHITGLQANHVNWPQIHENSGTIHNFFAPANLSQTMANEGGGEEDSEKLKSNVQVKKTFSNPAINLELVTSPWTGKATTRREVDKDEEKSCQKRIRLICERLKQSEAAAAELGYGYDLRPRHRGKVIKTQSLERVKKEKNQKPSSSKANEVDDILIIDMLGEEMKRKLRGSVEKKAAEKKT